MRLRGCSWCSNCWIGRNCTSCFWWSWWWCRTDAFTRGSFKRETSTLTLYRVPDGIDPMLTCLETHIYQVVINHKPSHGNHYYSSSKNVFLCKAGIADMVASAEVITADSEKYVEQLLELFRRFSLLVSQVACWISTVFWQMAKPQGFRDDPRFLTSRDKAYKRVVNDTSIFKLDLPSTRLAQSTRGRVGG